MKNGRVIFAEQLRVLAFLSVVITHWIGVFWIHPDVISNISLAPLMDTTGINPYKSILLPVPNWNYGPFGVSIFFLISGFVIPFSLRHKSNSGFIVARLLRIYPTYIACAILSILIVYITATAYWSVTPQFRFLDIIANLSLTHMYFGIKSIDAVNWTLAIEVMFYIFCVISRPFIISKNYLQLIISMIVLSVLFKIACAHLTNNSAINIFISEVASNYCYMMYMMIGVFFYKHHTGAIDKKSLIFAVTLVFVLFVASSIYMTNNILTPVVQANYFYGLVIFSIAYYKRNSFRESKVLGYLASISYPFYALHSVIGFCVIRMLFDAGLNFYASALIAFIAVLGLSHAVHVSVERKSISIGKLFK
ncbi:acyltransferase family protein [Hafnia psychrotolerans]|uniref:Acyltransferase 3 domain-containing protein n=1 Tax=Hafnia psychrotolerans TaxID=1477018 RepID=A0ABQ1G0B7_9GAMM|nr:acyltransferase [Hafnia psychrotolerans]GGA34124.1 hypothetical protein GCM10011328_06220 [Hafnia psychrotolerans]